MLVFNSWSVRAKSLHADKADCFIVPTDGWVPFSLAQVSRKQKLFGQHLCSHLLGLSENRKPLALCQLPCSSKALGHSLDSTEEKVFKKSIEINLIYICLFLKALLEATQFKCFALSHLLSSDCKTTVSHMQIFNLSDPRWDGSPSDSFIFRCSQTNMAASEDLSERERERERGGLAHTSPLLLIYLRTSEGAMSGFITKSITGLGRRCTYC